MLDTHQRMVQITFLMFVSAPVFGTACDRILVVNLLAGVWALPQPLPPLSSLEVDNFMVDGGGKSYRKLGIFGCGLNKSHECWGPKKESI